MGVPGFYSWLIKRYPLVKHMVDKFQLPSIDYLYLDMNGIIYKCVKDDSIIFKSQILPKQLEQIWLQVFNYIDMIVRILKPNKMIVMALDGVAPRSKMNNQRARRFKSGRDHKRFMQAYYGFTGDTESQQNFKNNSISPGTQFMEKLNHNIDFFIKKKIQQDDYWKKLSVIFTGSDVPGEGEHKIMEFIRANSANFDIQDNHCLYGADADLIMLSMTLPIKNLCIIREQYIPSPTDVKIIKSKQKKEINFEIIFVTILRQYFEIQYKQLMYTMKIQFDIKRVIADFVFLFFFIGNDFLPRCMAYNIRQASIQCLIGGFKAFLIQTDSYISGDKKINLHSLTLLARQISQFQPQFIGQKADQLNKMIENKVQFQTQLSTMMKVKAKNQQQFLLALKSSYLNENTEVKSQYYQLKFKITPATQINQYYQILYYYLHGLQFVYEYYFTGLPSWQWYYPYYYAPLLSDLYCFLVNYIQSGYQIEQIFKGTPSQPFKQLMCILPKQSAELLPKSFHHLLVSTDSPLRSPYDFYPDEFEDDLYGSTRSHEAVSLIPYLNLELVNETYQIAIRDVAEEDLRRNRFGESMLYQFHQDGSQIQIQSEFESIQKVRCTISLNSVDLRSSFMWKSLKNQLNTRNQLLRMPSLSILRFQSIPPVSVKQKSFVLALQMSENYENGLKTGSQVFYGYPLEHSGKIEAILTADSFNYIRQFDPYNYQLDSYNKEFCNNRDAISKMTREVLDWLKVDYVKKMRNKLEWSKIKQLVFIKDTMSFVRCRNGYIKKIYQSDKNTTYTTIPSQLVSNTRKYETTRQDIIVNNVTEEFSLGEDVLCFPKFNPESKNENRGPQHVIKGQVSGFTNDLQKVKVKIISKIKGISQNILKPIINTNQIYYTLSFAAFLVQIKKQILLTMLDSISISTQSADLPPSIDIGLNFISRGQKKLVPNLVRLKLSDKVNIEDLNIQKQFKRLQISQRGIDLILEYRQNFPNIFNFIVDRHEKLVEERDEKGKINWRQNISLTAVFKQKQQSKALKSLVNVYLWLIKKQQAHMPLSSIFSKQVSQKKIQEMLNIFNENERKQQKKKYQQPKQIVLDPNYVFSRKLAETCSFNLSKDNKDRYPKPHTIRDQVVCLRPQFFGDYGIIVGVDNNKYEVLFKKPRFGKTDLNGLCKKLHGGKFVQRQLYNMDIYPKYIIQRSNKAKNTDQNIGFLGNHESFAQKYGQNAIDNFADIQKLAESLKKLKKNEFTDKFLRQVQRVKKEQKVEKIDPQYHVVDNHQKQYKYKYDKGQSNVDQKYTQKMAKQMKYREKTAVQIAQQIKGVCGDYESEVIESKTLAKKQEQPKNESQQKKQVPENKQESQNEEQDGDDILTAV